ncbi:translocation/assembly module TamB domain-containing protein [candidate division KSB1 bacterium]|nr:translocation/assembly module TamB domain-containing protein [candidate division KSB1 bacterium]
MNKMLKKIYKTVLIFIIILLVFLTGIGIFTQTGIFKNWLKKQIISNAGKALDGSLYLDEIKANLVSNLAITDLSFSKGLDTLVHIPSLKIQFRPLQLIYKKISFRAVRIESLQLKIIQLHDSTWNFESIVTENKNKPKPTVGSDFSWQLSLDNLSLNNGSVTLTPLDDSLRSLCIKNITAVCSLNYENNNFTGLLENLSFQVREPQLSLNQLYVNLSFTGNNLNISQFNLRSDASILAGNVSVNLKNPGINTLQLNCTPLDLSEIKKFVPALPVFGSLNAHLTAQTVNDSLFFDASLNKNNEQLGLHGSVTNLTAIPGFLIDMDFSKFNLTTWLENTHIMTNLTGRLNLEGSGKDLKTANARLITELAPSGINNLQIRSLTAAAEILNRKIKTKINTVTNAGKAIFSGQLDINNNMNTDATCRFHDINLNKFLPNLTTAVSGQFNLSGLLDPKKPDVKFSANLSRSFFNNIPVDTLFTNLNFAGQLLNIDSLYLKTRPGQINVNGHAGTDSVFALNFNYDIGDLSGLMDSTKLAATGKITGNVTGKIDSFQLKTNYTLVEALYENYHSELISGSANVRYSKKEISGSSDIKFHNNNVSGFKIDSVGISVGFTDNCIDNSIHVAVNDTINGKMNSVLCLADHPKLTIHDILFNIGKKQWYGDNYPIQVEIKEKDYIINHFTLRSGEQSVSLDGGFGETGEEQLTLIMKDIDLAKISPFFNPEMTINGILNVQSLLSGSFNEPQLQGTISLTNAMLNTFSIENLSTKVNYKNNLCFISSALNRKQNEKIELTGELPVNFPLQNNEWISKGSPLYLHILSENINISFLDLLSNNLTKTSGKLALDIKVTETLNNPVITGTLAVNNVFISVPQYGSNFYNVAALLKLQDNKIDITNISAQNEKGFINIKGDIVKAKNQFVLQDMNLFFKADNFPLAKNQNLELTINSNISLTGNINNPAFDGSIDILRSKIYLPAFQTQQKPAAVKRPTLLTNIDSNRTIAKTKKTDSELLEKLRGKIKVNIPRNAWIRNDDMNIELSGHIDVLKESPVFELFGTVQTVRGTLDLYGRKFKISEGQIVFEGGKESAPNLNIEAVYDFRDAYSAKRQLKLKITGKTTQPVITFYLDNSPVEEKDAIAYLVFGRNSDELSFGEKSQLAENEGLVSSARLEQLLTSRMTGELKNKLLRKLNLDVIEFKGNGNLRQASIVLGKYITNDLFLSYKKDFRLGRSHEMVPEEISLEYEINRFLFLQATKGDDKTTGFDIFWKYEK